MLSSKNRPQKSHEHATGRALVSQQDSGRSLSVVTKAPPACFELVKPTADTSVSFCRVCWFSAAGQCMAREEVASCVWLPINGFLIIVWHPTKLYSDESSPYPLVHRITIWNLLKFP